MILNWLGYLFAASGFVLFGWISWALWRARCSLKWPSAVGIVTASRIDQRVIQSTRVRRDRTINYEVKIHYGFNVKGRKHTGTRIGFLPVSVAERDAKDMAETLCAGASVKVFYHPRRPELCTLKRGTTFVGWTLLGLATLMILLTFGVMSGLVRLDPAPSTSAAHP